MKSNSKNIFSTLFFIFLFMVVSAQTSIKSLLADGSKIFAGTNYGVFVNDNDQFEWKPCNIGLPDNADVSILERHKNGIFGAALGLGLFTLPDGDTVWKKIITLPPAYIRINALFSNDTALFVVDLNQGIIYTADNGINWKEIDLMKQLNPVAEKTDEPEQKNKSRNKQNESSEEISRKNESKTKITDLIASGNILFAGISSVTPGYGIYKSEDAGKNWIETSYDLQRVNIKKIIPHKNKMYALTSGFNGEVYCSEDNGIHWQKLSKTPLRRVSLFCAGDHALFTASQRDGICVSYDSGLTWEKLECMVLASDQTIDHLAVTKDGLYVGTSDGIILLVEENRKWKIGQEGLKTKKSGSFFYADIGTKKGVTLSASKYADEIIFKAVNTTDQKMNVDIQLVFVCGYSNEYGSGTFPERKMEWRITVNPNSVMEYDTNPAACSVSSCKETTVRWEIIDWKAE